MLNCRIAKFLLCFLFIMILGNSFAGIEELLEIKNFHKDNSKKKVERISSICKLDNNLAFYVYYSKDDKGFVAIFLNPETGKEVQRSKLNITNGISPSICPMECSEIDGKMIYNILLVYESEATDVPSQRRIVFESYDISLDNKTYSIESVGSNLLDEGSYFCNPHCAKIPYKDEAFVVYTKYSSSKKEDGEIHALTIDRNMNLKKVNMSGDTLGTGTFARTCVIRQDRLEVLEAVSGVASGKEGGRESLYIRRHWLDFDNQEDRYKTTLRAEDTWYKMWAQSKYPVDICPLIEKFPSGKSYLLTWKDDGGIFGALRHYHIKVEEDGISTLKKKTFRNNLYYPTTALMEDGKSVIMSTRDNETRLFYLEVDPLYF